MKLFHDIETTDWTRVSVIVLAAGSFWGTLATVLPPKIHAWGVALIAGITAAVSVMMKSGHSPKQETKEAVESIQEKKQEIKDAEKEIGKINP